MTRHAIGPLDDEPLNVRPPFDVRVPPSPPPVRRLIGPDTTFEAWRGQQIADRAAALTEPLAGLVLGTYDRRVVEWLAGFDVPTIGGVACLLHRARAARPLRSTP